MDPILRSMRRIRTIEEALATAYPSGVMKTPTHFSIGQEAVAAGVCSALTPADIVTAGHRCHAAYLAKGGNLDRMVAELYGKATGCCGGHGGSVHLRDPAAGFLGASALLGQMIPVAVGAAWALKLDALPHVAVTFFGDGAIEEGVTYEAFNFAAVHHLPVIFVCENNEWATHSGMEVRQPPSQIYRRFENMMGTLIVPPSHTAIAKAAALAVARCVAGDGPMLLEVPTYRYREHVGPLYDWDRGYRTEAEGRAWMDADPLRNVEDQPEDIAEIAAAITAAEAAPWPEVPAWA